MKPPAESTAAEIERDRKALDSIRIGLEEEVERLRAALDRARADLSSTQVLIVAVRSEADVLERSLGAYEAPNDLPLRAALESARGAAARIRARPERWFDDPLPAVADRVRARIERELFGNPQPEQGEEGEEELVRPDIADTLRSVDRELGREEGA